MASVFSRIAGLVRGGVRSVMSPASAHVVFTDLAPEDHQRLERQRALVLAAARSVVMELHAWTRTTADLEALQRLMDEAVFEASQTHELQSVGVVFGDVLETELKLQWVAVMDDEGTYPVLRVANTMVQVDVMTSMPERVASGERVDFQKWLEAVRAGLPR